MSVLPSLRQLSYLVALSEHLSFTLAADACFVTQSTLSAGIKELETTLGVQLVERERHRVVLTPVGAEVVAHAQGVLAAGEDLVQVAARNANPLTGVIRIGVIPTIIPFLLAEVFPEMQRRYPNLKLALREDLSDNLLKRLNDGQLDFVLLALPYDTGNLLVQHLFEEALWLVTPVKFQTPKPSKLVKHLSPEPLSIEQLDTENLLLLGEGHCLRGHTLLACGIKARTADTLEATSLYTLVQMVSAGLGLALVPEMSLRSGLLKGLALTAHPFAKPAPSRGIALAARTSTARREAFDVLSALITQVWDNAKTSTRIST